MFQDCLRTKIMENALKRSLLGKFIHNQNLTQLSSLVCLKFNIFSKLWSLWSQIELFNVQPNSEVEGKPNNGRLHVIIVNGTRMMILFLLKLEDHKSKNIYNSCNCWNSGIQCSVFGNRMCFFLPSIAHSLAQIDRHSNCQLLVLCSLNIMSIEPRNIVWCFFLQHMRILFTIDSPLNFNSKS